MSQTFISQMSAGKFLHAIVFLNGVLLLVTGLMLAFNPAWFYTLASFGPFNRHFMGDAGIFSAGLGGMLLLALRHLPDSQGLILIGSLTALWHGLNHAYDHWCEQGTAHLLSDGMFWRDSGLMVLGGLSLLALLWYRKNQRGAMGRIRTPP